MKKAISMGLTALMFFSVLVVVDLVPLGNVSADTETNAPYDTGNGNPPGDGVLENDPGDWIISWSATPDYIEYTNTTIILNGNLIIEQDAELILRNVTLKMNVNSDGEFNITVQPGGTLRILDIDNNPSTMNDASNITSNTAFHYEFKVEGPDGFLEMRNSELHECGYSFSKADKSDGGLWIAGDADIEYNEISDCWAGIIVYETGSSMGPPIEIGPNNTISDCYWGVTVSSSTNINIHNNSIVTNTMGGVSIDSSGSNISNNISLQDNNISANSDYSLDIMDSNDIMILRNEINSSDLAYLDTITGLEIRNNYFCQGGTSVEVTYFLVRDANDFIFDSNVLNDNVGISSLFNTCWATTISNNDFKNNGGGGFGVHLGSYDTVIKGNNIIGNKDMGLHIVGHNINITDNLFEGNGDGVTQGGDPTWQDCGLEIMNSYDIYVTNNRFIQNINTSPTGDHVDGIYLFGSNRITTVYMENNTMDRNDYNLHCRGGVSVIDVNSTYILSTLPTPTPYDVYLEQAVDAYPSAPDNHITFLNTTFDNSSVYIGDPGSDHTVKWYKHIKTEDYGGSPVSGANIWIDDSYGDPEPAGQPFTTDSNGWMTFIPLTEYIQDSSTKTFYTPHSIQVTDGARVGLDLANMWHSHVNTLILNDKPIVSSLQTEYGPTGSVYRTDTIIIRVEGSDIEESNNDLTPHIQFRVNETSTWVDESSPYFGTWSYDSGNDWWEISFTPPADAVLDNYGFRVSINDTYPSYSDWFVVNDMVEVLNNPPNAEDILESGPSVYRGDNIEIFADASDIEDIDEDGSWSAVLEYKLANSTSWSSVYVTGSGYDSFTENWKFLFEPPGTRPDPKHGLADFRVKFTDSDGDESSWYTENNLIHIYNVIPTVSDIKSGQSEIKRGEYTWVFANGTDTEETEGNLNVEFFYDVPGGGITWIQDNFIGSAQFDNIYNLWKIQFLALPSDPIGDYYFMIRFTDSDGDYDELVGGIYGKVNVKNNLPTVVDIKPSKPEVIAGAEYIYIHVNATDYEDNEADMILLVEHRYGSESWKTDYIVGSTIYDPSGWLKIKFEPDAAAPLGDYDFRVKVVDTDGGQSTDWVQADNIVSVQNPEPILEDITLGATEVYRNDTIHIFVNASDPAINESDLTIEVQYSPPSGGWIDITVSPSDFNSLGGFWVIPFTPNLNAELGQYHFRGRVFNGIAYSNGGNYDYTVDDAEVMNNPPDVLDIIPSKPKVNAGTEFIYIHVNATDVEDATSDLALVVEHRNATGSWESKFIVGPTIYDPLGWLKIKFEPTSDAQLGLYDFRVKVVDRDNDSSIAWFVLDDGVEVVSLEPILEDLVLGASFVYRNNTLYMFLNATDTVDYESNLTPEVQYKAPSGGWVDIPNSSMYYVDTNGNLSDDIGYWFIEFAPNLTAETGLYQFRGRVKNTAEVYSNGGAYTLSVPMEMEVRNNPPVVNDIWSESSTVTRGNTIYIYVDVNDLEDPEDELDIYLEYRAEGGTWDDYYLSDYQFDTFYNSWRIMFSPPSDVSFSTGLYDFQVFFEDNDGAETMYTKLDLVEVKNALPTADSLNVPSTSGYPLEPLIITADGTDADHGEAGLTAIFEYSVDGVNWVDYQDPGSYFTGSPTYTSGHWQITFYPPVDAYVGLYSFRVQFSDGIDTSNRIELMDYYTLMALDVMVLDLNVPPSGYRVETVYITANATDPGGTESGLTAMFEYMEPMGSTWITQGTSGGYFSGTPQYTGEFWHIAFSPPADAQLGLYSFRVQFSNSTNTSSWETELDSFTLLNNIPKVVDLMVPFSGYRLETIYITANGRDQDDIEEDLTPIFQYKDPNDSDWISLEDPGNYFNGTPQYTDEFWQIAFTAPADADLGDYSFRVRFSDEHDTGDWFEKLDSLALINNAPEVEALTVPPSGYRLEAIYITANGTDPDGSEYALTPSFQYKGPLDSEWISQGDLGSYFTGEPQYVSGNWRIEFIPPVDADLGKYSFTVQFSDGIYPSQWTTQLDSFTLMNNKPSVQITSPSSGEQSSASVTFTALASDIEDSTFTYEWDFGDGSPVSSEESPTHNYSKEGDYVVSVTVKDKDGGTVEDNLTISIPKETLPKEKEPEFDSMVFVLSLIPLLLAILIILFLLARRKKKEEEEPPLAPGTMPVPEEEPEDEFALPEEPSTEETTHEPFDEEQTQEPEPNPTEEKDELPSSEDQEEGSEPSDTTEPESKEDSGEKTQLKTSGDND
ncbi:MAG: right-handed parallel beta-helix repeat-containing protein [Thermoplasmata archaeon]|nr:MAG: right-handed parallel beta-helix repeat-containing protein [Thermoplasmata archaeon]